MIVDKVWKLTNTVRVGLDDRFSHEQIQSTFPDNVCSHCPPCHGHSVTLENLIYFFVFLEFFSIFSFVHFFSFLKNGDVSIGGHRQMAR